MVEQPRARARRDAVKRRLPASGRHACSRSSRIRSQLTDAQTDAQYNTRVTHLAASGDYMLTSEAMRRLQQHFGELTVDAFASGATALLPRFWSRDAVPGAEAVDAFAQSWAGEALLCHAPVGCIEKLIEKLCAVVGTRLEAPVRDDCHDRVVLQHVRRCGRSFVQDLEFHGAVHTLSL